MGRISKFIEKTLLNFKSTVVRFPTAVIFALLITVLISLQVENKFPDSREILIRLAVAASFGVFLSTAIQFTIETFSKLIKYKWLLHILGIIISFLYYLTMTSPGSGRGYMMVRILVVCFALLAYYIWIPSWNKNTVFPQNALVHFKSFFVSVLYSLVLAIGLLAIYAAIDLLLVDLDGDIPSHIFNIMGTFFFPLYYLSLLPDFSSDDAKMILKKEKASIYPQFLQILVSYIIIPLITVFTAVLVVYAVKILVTRIWPVGELGPMILTYSAVGLFVYVLCGKLDNNFAMFYKRIFPFVLIPLVVLQLYSVFIRVNAYGITESRYYVILFGIYSILCSLILIISKGSKISFIALLAAIFALLSITPQIDAFTISRNSQANRVLGYLEKNSMLSGDKIIPSSNIPDEDKAELTDIMNYLYRMDHTQHFPWLPEDYNHYEDFRNIFGFEPYYRSYIPSQEFIYRHLALDPQYPFDISGFSTMLRVSFSGWYSDSEYIQDTFKTTFNLNNDEYALFINNQDPSDIIFIILDEGGEEVAAVHIKDLLKKLSDLDDLQAKGLLPPSDLSFDVQGENIVVRVLFNNIGFRQETDGEFSEIYGDALILVK
jgi:hypothetical protein